LQFGRTKILRDETEITADNVAQVLLETYRVHADNSAYIATLYSNYKGNQAILNRTKTVRPEICNKIVENRANEIVSFKTGYLCGEPLQYVSRGADDTVSADIGKLNDMMLLCGKSAQDKNLAEWMYIAGQGYRMVLPNSERIWNNVIPSLLNKPVPFTEDDAPFSVYTLDPRQCYVVYHSGLGEPPLMCVKYVTRKDNTVVYSVYTPTQYFELTGDSLNGYAKVASVQDSPIGYVPIIEYPLNTARLGVFEIVMPLLDAINTVQSNRIDGIEQFVQSLLVLYNCDIDDDLAKSLREYGLIKLKSSGDQKADVKEIATQLNQSETQTLIDYMYQTVLNIVGMPNRNGGSSTSDTGSAVVMRDGWEAAEARAKCDELMFKESERQFLKIVLRIVRDTAGTKLKLSDIETKFTRRNYENIATKAQVLTTMLNSPQIAPSLAFQHCGMFSDPEDAAKQSAEYYEQNKSGGDGTIA
jgi:SPP1 family phage portal protein